MSKKNISQNKKQPQKAAISTTTTKKVEKAEKPYGIGNLLLKGLVLVLAVVAVVSYTDKKGYFEPDARNNHTENKWTSFYKFTKNNDMDIVMLGNSRLYTAINPKNLSCALGVNSFMLASPGTVISDTYYCLKEAITVCKPKIVIIETGVIGDIDTYSLNAEGLSNHFKSFYARKNFGQKISSMPFLFTPDNYFAAWSNSVRNHSFIFSDTAQIHRNIRHDNHLPITQGKFYLGRYARFSSGIEENILQKIRTVDARKADGKEFTVSDEARHYIRKMVELCEKNNIKLIFLTIPIYSESVINQDIKRKILEKELAPYNPVWLDLQTNYDTIAFQPDCFENIEVNQHMTYTGSLVATYKVAHFIHENLPNVLPNRGTDYQWRNLFYGEEGYFENFSPAEHNLVQTLFRDIALPNSPVIKEIDIVQENGFNVLLVKVDRQMPDLRYKKLRITFIAQINGQMIEASLDFAAHRAIDPINHYLFTNAIRKDLKLLAINSVQILP